MLTLLSEILGFDQSTFSTGEYIAQRDLDGSLYSRVPKTQSFVVRLTRWDEEEYEIKEPLSLEPENITLSIALAVKKAQLNIAVIEDEGLLKLELRDEGIRLKLPAALNRYLNSAPTYNFREPVTEVPFPRKVEAVSVPSKPKDIPLIYVNSDCIVAQRISGSFQPILRCIPRPTNGTTDWVFSPVFYLQPLRSDLETIRIRLQDSDFTLLQPFTEPTVVIPHTKNPIMKRKVLCNKTNCSLDRLPEQQLGGGLRVQEANYVIPLSRVTSGRMKKTQSGKGKGRRRRSASVPAAADQRKTTKKSSASRRRKAAKKTSRKKKQ
jgi:hypothetical protein